MPEYLKELPVGSRLLFGDEELQPEPETYEDGTVLQELPIGSRFIPNTQEEAKAEGLSLVLDAFKGVPRNSAATLLRAYRGEGASGEDSWLDQAIDYLEKPAKTSQEKYQKDTRTAFGIPLKELASLEQNLGFTGGNMAASLAAGAATAPIPIPGSSVAAGAGTSFVVAKRAASDMFADDLMKTLDDAAKAAYGRPLTVDERKAAKQLYSDQINRYGLWEGGTESASTALEWITVLGKRAPFLGPAIGTVESLLKLPTVKSALVRSLMGAGAKFGLMNATELTEEAITQAGIPGTSARGQAGIEAESGMRDPYKGWTEEAKDVVTPVLLQTAVTAPLMIGGGSLVGRTRDKPQEDNLKAALAKLRRDDRQKKTSDIEDMIRQAREMGDTEALNQANKDYIANEAARLNDPEEDIVEKGAKATEAITGRPPIITTTAEPVEPEEEVAVEDYGLLGERPEAVTAPEMEPRPALQALRGELAGKTGRLRRYEGIYPEGYGLVGEEPAPAPIVQPEPAQEGGGVVPGEIPVGEAKARPIDEELDDFLPSSVPQKGYLNADGKTYQTPKLTKEQAKSFLEKAQTAGYIQRGQSDFPGGTSAYYLQKNAPQPPAVEAPKAEKPSKTFEEFAKEYRAAFKEMIKYGPDQVGSRVFAEKMAEMSDEHPDWVEKIEAEEEGAKEGEKEGPAKEKWAPKERNEIERIEWSFKGETPYYFTDKDYPKGEERKEITRGGYEHTYHSPNRPLSNVVTKADMPNVKISSSGKYLFSKEPLSLKQLYDWELVGAHVDEKAQIALDYYESKYGDGERPVELFKDLSGEKNRTLKWQGAIVHKSTLHEGGWRVTFFDEHGFSGHDEHKTKLDAVKQAFSGGYNEPKPGLLDDVQQTPTFIKGVLANDERQKAHQKWLIDRGKEEPVVTPTTTILADQPARELPIASIKQSKEVPNFKEGATREGVVEPLAGKYKRTPLRPIVVWERQNGDLEVITGRHRLDLARRSGEATIFAQVVRESEGFTKAMAITLDSESNIEDNQGSVKDYANYFRNVEITETEASGRGLLARDKGRTGFRIGKDASDNLYTGYRAGKVSEAKTLAIATAAPKNESLQTVGIKYALTHNAEDTANYLRAIQTIVPESTESQVSLFGENESWQVEADKMAKSASKMIYDMEQEKSALRAAGKLGKEKFKSFIEKYGVNPGNPEAIEKRLAELDKELYRMSKWPTDHELVTQIREAAGLKEQGRGGDQSLDLKDKQTGNLFAPREKESFKLEPSESTPQEKAALRESLLGEKRPTVPKTEVKPRAAFPTEKIQPGTGGKTGNLFGPAKGETGELFGKKPGEQALEVGEGKPKKITVNTRVRYNNPQDEYGRNGLLGTVTGTWGNNAKYGYLVDFDLGLGIVAPASQLEIIGKVKIDRPTIEKNTTEVDKWVNSKSGSGYFVRKAEASERLYRVIWTSPTQDIIPNTLDAVGLADSSKDFPNLRAVHITNDPEYWADKLTEDYERGGKYHIVEIEAIEGDAIADDPQYAIPDESGYKADSHILVTSREAFKRQRKEKGAKVFLSIGEGTPTGLTKGTVDALLVPIRKSLPNAPTIIAAKDYADLPDAVKNGPLVSRLDETTKGMIRGVHHIDENGNTTIYLVANNFNSIRDVFKTAIHEIVGHAGLREALSSEKAFGEFLNQLYAAKESDPLMQMIRDKYGFDVGTAKGRQKAADEWFARTVVEKGHRDPALREWWARFVRMFREWARKARFRITLSDAEIADVINRAWGQMQAEGRGEAVGGEGQAAAIKEEGPLDRDGNELVDMDGVPIETNPDGTVTLYHRTSQGKADAVKRTGVFRSLENTNETFFSNKLKGQAEGYGDAVIAVKVKPSATRINDAFHGGEIHVAVSNKLLSRRNLVPIPDQSLLFGGEKMMGDKTPLAAAKALEARGTPMEEIRKATGWERAPWKEGEDGGKWRFEIDDGKAKIKPSGERALLFPWEVGKPMDGEGIPLPDLLDHPDIFKRYPAMGDVTVQVATLDNMSPGTVAAFGTSDRYPKGVITINTPRDVNNYHFSPETKTSLIHEIQHFIQTHEGFALGGYPEATSKGVLQPLRLARKMQVALGEKPDMAELKAQFGKSPDFAVAAEIATTRTKDQITREIRKIKQSTEYDVYRRTAGEYEARKAAERAKLTAEERKAQAPWKTGEVIPVDDLIIRMKGGQQALSIEIDTNPPKDESKYVKTSEVYKWLSDQYYKDGNRIANSRLVKAGWYPWSVGNWQIDDEFKGIYGRDIEQLRYLPVKDIELTEEDWTKPINYEGRGDDARRYSQWMKEGAEAPPIRVLETYGRTMRVTDGHRRLAAAKMAGKDRILAWVSPVMDTGKKDFNGEPILAGLTYEGMMYGAEEANRQIEQEGRDRLKRVMEAKKGEQALDLGPGKEDSLLTTIRSLQTPGQPRELVSISKLREAAGTGGKVFYRGTVPNETKRIDEVFEAAKGKTFVAREKKNAQMYGENIEEITASPNSKILYQEDAEFWKLLGKRKPPNGAIESVSGGAIENVNAVIKKAEKAGYDAISFSHDSGIGTVILNESAFSKSSPLDSQLLDLARQGKVMLHKGDYEPGGKGLVVDNPSAYRGKEYYVGVVPTGKGEQSLDLLDISNVLGGKEKAYNQRAIRKYGLTTVPESIGYITRDGKGIDSSGRRQGSRSEGRNVDHREIAQEGIGEDTVPDDSFTGKMTAFMNETGDIRVIGAKGELNVDVPIARGMPTNKQLQMIQRLAEGKSLVFDLTDEKGNVVAAGQGGYGEFLKTLKDTIRAESDTRSALAKGTIPTQLQPMVDFIKRHNLSKEEFHDARYNKKNPLFDEYRREMDKTGLGVTKVWSDFGFTHEGEFYDKVAAILTGKGEQALEIGEVRPGDVNTKEFKAWFKGSRVVDADGKPLVVYHGTQKTDFSKFNVPAHFGDAEAANQRSFWWMFFDGSPSHPNVIPAYLSIQNPKRVKDAGQDIHWKEEIRKAKRQGYDGLVYQNTAEGGESYVAFSPTQIKSVFNRGTWSPTEPDISLEIAEPIGKALDVLPAHVRPRVESARGIKEKPWVQRATETAKQLGWFFTPGRQFVLLNPNHYPKEVEILRHAKEISTFSKFKAVSDLRTILQPEGLSEDNYWAFSLKLILSDMKKDLAPGRPLENWQDDHGELPFGFKTEEELNDAIDKLNAKIENTPAVKSRLAAREKLLKDLRQQLVDRKILPEKVLSDPDYWHHQVLEYAETKANYTGTSSKDFRTHKKGWQIHRIGSIKDYNTDYFQAEFEIIAQGHAVLEMLKDMDEMEEASDISKRLRQRAKHMNYVAVVGGQENYDRLVALRAEARSIRENEYLESEDRKQLKAIAEEIRELDPTMPYRSKIAMGYAKLNKELGLDEDMDSDEVGLMDEGDLPFSEIARLAEEGHVGAATILKGVAERNQFIKETLGGGYETHLTLMRKEKPREGSKGWTTWKPKPNTAWYITNSLNDKIIEQLLAGERQLGDEDVKKVLARGFDRQWIIPVELATTLDAFQKWDEGTIAGKISESILTKWKQWVLINPARIIKYNLNNLSGDADIALAYDPGIFKYVKEAMADLWAFHHNKPMTAGKKAEFEKALRDGVIGSGMTVHDIPDLLKSADVQDLTMAIRGEKPNVIMRYWRGSKNFTTWRENVLRMATYRRFQDRLNKGEKIYGASNPKVVENAPDDRKAALLARQLIGDYGALSEGGQWLRRRVIPFYSWMEINGPRYVRMLRNIRIEGQGMGRPVAVISGAMARKSAFLGVKMMGLYALISLFNHLVWPDEEEELGETGRRQLHLILGRREDGSIMTLRVQGALSDALGWFGMEDFPADMKDLATGKKTVYEWLGDIPYSTANRLIQAARPDVKAGAELLSGKQFYPEFTKPRAIRDKAEYIARFFSMEPIYKRIAGKPLRGESTVGRLWADIQGLATYSSNPGEIAYHEVRKEANEWLEKQKVERPAVEPTSKSNALYYYRQALSYGDDKAALKYLKDYKALGGTTKGMKQSIKLAHPMAGIPSRYKFKFMQSLDEGEKARLKYAVKWYNETYKRPRPISRPEVKENEQQPRRLLDYR